MGFTTNRDDVENQIRSGGWAVAFGRELTYDDAAEGVVAAGVSIATDEPGPFDAWLDELITQSVTQLGVSIAQNLIPAARQAAIQFAGSVLRSRLQGHDVGEQAESIQDFNLKAGLAQFNGQNTQWVPDISESSIGNFFTSGDTGGHEENVGPPVISYCPYVGFRYNPTAVNPPPSTSLHRIEWVGDNGNWYHLHQPGLWHEFTDQHNPVFKSFTETGRDDNYVYLKDQTAGSNLELALSATQRLYHYTDGQPGWHPDIQGHWQA